jgi:chromosomal replication initiator protein
MPRPALLWDGVLRRLGAEMPAFALEAWMRPLVPEIRSEGLVLLCPTSFHCERVRAQYLPRIERCVAVEAGQSLPVSLSVMSEAPPREAAGKPVTSAPRAAAEAHRARPSEPARPDPAGVAQFSLPYTFDSFVVGPCNALAREASVAVATGRQKRLNPLYLSAGTGLGKTHLARAIVAEARRNEAARPLYASAESFTNAFMASIRARRMDDFKRRFRKSCDLLVIEDVQFLGAKRATQLELFHTVAHLLDVGTRVVLTADRLPRAIDGLDPRLRSAMASGLVAELEPPDAAVRREILGTRAASGGVRLPDDCLDLLVDRLRGSVRDLEGVLIQLVASASLLKRPIDLALTEAALHKVSPRGSRAPGLDPAAVTEVVATFFRTTPETLGSRSRRRDVLIPRQLAMYLCARYTDRPLSEIARGFGRKHPSVSNAVSVVERAILERAPLRYKVEALTEKIEARARDASS